MTRLYFCALIILATPAVAQRGGQGGLGNMGRANAGFSGPGVITGDTLSKLNPISALVERRKDLKLTDAQVTNLGAILARLDVQNAPFLRQLDSIATAMGSPPIARWDPGTRTASGCRPIAARFGRS